MYKGNVCRLIRPCVEYSIHSVKRWFDADTIFGSTHPQNTKNYEECDGLVNHDFFKTLIKYMFKT